jgi:hypothetical protein
MQAGMMPLHLLQAESVELQLAVELLLAYSICAPLGVAEHVLVERSVAVSQRQRLGVHHNI